jgi:hypothetical protein
MRKVLLMAATVACSTSTLASNWVEFGQNEVGTFYFDRQTMRREGGDIRRVWVLMNRDTPTETGALSSKVLEELDCRQGQRRILQIADYTGKMGTGSPQASRAQPGNWSYPPPDTVAESLMTTVCGIR